MATDAAPRERVRAALGSADESMREAAIPTMPRAQCAADVAVAGGAMVMDGMLCLSTQDPEAVNG